MPRIAIEAYSPQAVSQKTIQRANDICAEYVAKGYRLTVRQLYYQFVARTYIPNSELSYKNFKQIILRAREGGYLDWDYIVDRSRRFRRQSHWDSPASIIRSVANDYQIDKWVGQPYRIEVWVEKEALEEVVGRVATRQDVNYFPCKGYVSASEMWGASKRLKRYKEDDADQRVVILYLGDHDPSGVDMNRDIEKRFNQFGCYPEVRRIALTMAQIEQYNLPPNPTKEKDKRTPLYIAEYGTTNCWELDALEPDVINDLIESHILDLRDDDLWSIALDDEEVEQAELIRVSDNWEQVVRSL